MAEQQKDEAFKEQTRGAQTTNAETEQAFWFCSSCGTRNTGKFCSSCGKPMNAAPEAFQKSQPVQQQYVQQVMVPVAAMPMVDVAQMKAVKKVSKSWPVLVLAIMATVSLACVVLDCATSFTSITVGLGPIGMLFKILGLVVKAMWTISIAALLCAGSWKIFKEGKASDDTPMTGKGFKNLRSALTMRFVVYLLIGIGIMIVAFIIFGIGSCADSVSDSSEGGGTLVGILAILAAAVIIAFFSMYYNSVKGLLNDASKRITGIAMPRRRFIYAAIMLFLFSVFKIVFCSVKAVISLGKAALLAGVTGALSGMEGMEDVAGILGGSTISVVFSIIGAVATALTFIVAGILVIKYSNAANDPEKYIK